MRLAKWSITLLTASVAPAAGQSGGPAPDLCAVALRAVPEAGVCVATPLGVALAPDGETARRVARYGQAGEERFKLHFGRDAPRYVLFEMGDMDRLRDQRRAFAAAGFVADFAYLSNRAYADGFTASVRRGAEASARTRGLGPAETASAIDAALAAQRDKLTDYAMERQAAILVPHEVGHYWFIQTFWPGVHVDGNGHYGGPGPDWLDETAAILMESGDAADSRREMFRNIYWGRAPGHLAGFPVEKLLDLPLFLGRRHPLYAENEAMAQSARAGGAVLRVVSPGEARERVPAITEGIAFYLTSRMFADFLIDQTRDPAVFGSIGAAFARGETIGQWLAAEGARRGLAADVEALDAEWRAWLVGRFGPPASGTPS